MTQGKKKAAVILACFAVAACVILAVLTGKRILEEHYEPMSYPVYGFANMRGSQGVVYRGIGGAYGTELPVKASTFTVRDGKLYYAAQIKEDYVINEERTGGIWEADLSGENQRLLVEDAYNLGYGAEKLIGEKLFYPIEPDEEGRMRFAWYDLDTGETQEISSSRINTIIGYDGRCLFYGGYDYKKNRPIVGKYNLRSGRDRTLFSYKEANEAGDVISLHYADGSIYAVTLLEEMQDYDARTAVYGMIRYRASDGKKQEELPLHFTGSANYGFLYEGDTLYYATADGIFKTSIQPEEEPDEGGTSEQQAATSSPEQPDTALKQLVRFSEREYWGIPHFAPGDGCLYYETIADIDEDTGMNDYFYKVSLSGGEPQLLAAWFTS